MSLGEYVLCVSCVCASMCGCSGGGGGGEFVDEYLRMEI